VDVSGGALYFYPVAETIFCIFFVEWAKRYQINLPLSAFAKADSGKLSNFANSVEENNK
jgi:hypothetical protein